MNILSMFRNDRKVQVLVAVALFAVTLGFFVIPPAQALRVLTAGGYWAMLGTVAWFAWVLWTLMKASRPWALFPVRMSWGILLLILACGFVLLIHETYGFKILMDEVMLLGTSMIMHFD